MTVSVSDLFYATPVGNCSSVRHCFPVTQFFFIPSWKPSCLFPLRFLMPPSIMSNTKDAKEELSTAPFDPRFPNTNQTRYCYQSFVDYHRCRHVKGNDYEPCDYFKRVFTSVCPNAWIEKWDTQIEEGRFPGRLQ